MGPRDDERRCVPSKLALVFETGAGRRATQSAVARARLRRRQLALFCEVFGSRFGHGRQPSSASARSTCHTSFASEFVAEQVERERDHVGFSARDGRLSAR